MTREEAIKPLAKTWHYHTIEVWQRARYRCEYCEKNMLADPDIYLFDAHLDHIVPGAGNGGDQYENLALACKACNYIKRADDHRIKDGLNDRASLIRRAAEKIADIRKANRERLAKDIGYLKQLDLVDGYPWPPTGSL
jgi:5-methylcytosine-specific restriction endonuclease McrA